MALPDEALEAVLADTSLVNQPAAIPGGGGLSGPREVVPIAEQRDRRESLANLLSAGVSRDVMMKTMTGATKPDGSPGFGMTEGAVKQLIAEVYQTWREEDAEDRPHKKSAAVRRIKRTITRAVAKSAFTAVANLERTLMMIEGTAEPLKVEVSGVENVSVALLRVLNVQSPEQLEELVAGERAFLKDHGTALLPAGTDDNPDFAGIAGEVIDATPD